MKKVMMRLSKIILLTAILLCCVSAAYLTNNRKPIKSSLSGHLPVAVLPLEEKQPDSWEFLFAPDLGEGFSDPFSGKKFNGRIYQGGSSQGLVITTENTNEEKSESWTSTGNGAFIKKSKIHPLAKGKVTKVSKEGKFVILYHPFIENAKRKAIRIKFGNLDSIRVKEGDSLLIQDVIGECYSGKLLVSTLQPEKIEEHPFFFESPSWYLKEYSSLTKPAKAEVLLVVTKESYSLLHFSKGILKGKFDVCLGQSPKGHKVQQGDNRTPEGEYRITEKEKGPFSTPTGPWLGDRWMHFSYPNRYDAHTGFQNGIITRSQYNDIVVADKSGLKTNSYTELGGRVGLHGWNGEFVADGTQDLTWGCICMQNTDIINLFDHVPMNTKLLVLP